MTDKVNPIFGTRLCTELDDTRKLAVEIAAQLKGGEVIALDGPLGAGKTSFVQALAEALGVEDLSEVRSPTYTLVNEYPAEHFVLQHLDFYRLDDRESVEALGLDDSFGERGVVAAVEWADLIPDLIPPEAIWIKIRFNDDGERVFSIAAN
ncbi:tRNA (adenosine(37)-N6)-threonylcarbamoyltransferase complex ATPase subunit type 1 TsaE [Myxococcota bacterium]|nr:tRNA (adenosine(37)-N6)-threonylcarbamoyltransferase complex ATPase subunit type 1 TsaE [Myxococcota bacterium]